MGAGVAVGRGSMVLPALMCHLLDGWRLRELLGDDVDERA
jgi:hypothetical protein